MSEPDDSSRPDEAESLYRDYHGLDSETQAVLRAVAGEARRKGKVIRRAHRDGEVGAWPHLGGGVSWEVRQSGLEGARGMERIAADYEQVMTGIDQLQTLAAHWRAVDVRQLSRDPQEAKEAYAGVLSQVRAALDWADRQDVPDRAAQGLRCVTPIAAAAEMLRRALVEASRRPDWREAFDRAGWPDKPRIVLCALGGVIEGMVEAAERAAPVRAGVKDHKTRRVRR